MIKYAELRLTSYVIDKTGKVVQFYMSSLTTDCDNGKIFPAYISGGLVNLDPVPLTEEWLKKLGFSIYYEYTEPYDKLKHIKLKENFVLAENGDEWEFSYLQAPGLTKIKSGVSCKYVHELQNLYFVLNNKDLEILE